MVNSKISRRGFLKSATGATGLLILPSASAFGYAANEKVNIAIVGPGGRGNWFVTRIEGYGANVVAMCDVNEHRAARAFKVIPGAKSFHDYRKMLDKLGDEIEGVIVATPDNTHAIISAAAIRHGKGVLCEKPLTHDVFEARRLSKLAAEYKVATQMGNQGTSSDAYREAVQIIQDGVLGDVHTVHVWNTNGGSGKLDLPSDVHPVPAYLKWDLWLGPAKWREYNSRWMNWHSWRDFGTSSLGNWGCHTMNVLFRGLRLDSLWKNGGTFSLQAEVQDYFKNTFPEWEIVEYNFPAREGMVPVKVTWRLGSNQAPGPRKEIEAMMGRKLDWGDAGAKRWADHSGCLLVGTKGMLHSTSHNTTYALYPEEKFKDFKLSQRRLPSSPGHEREWLSAIQGQGQTLSNFGYAGPLTEFCLLGNVATQFKEKLVYDPKAMKIVNNDKADGLLRRDYRQGWSL